MNVTGTDSPFLFESERNGVFSYQIPVPCNAAYDVTLYFAGKLKRDEMQLRAIPKLT